MTNPNFKVDDPPAGNVLPDGGRVVPIGKIDGDPPLHGDPEPRTVIPRTLAYLAVQPLLRSPSTAPGSKATRRTFNLSKATAVAVGKSSPEYAQVLELAKLDLAERLGLQDTDPIRLATIAKVDWGNTSLGNPKPGMMYADVIVPGFKMLPGG